MMQKRFLLISSNSSGRGGGERYLVFLSRGLRELGFDVHVLLSSLEYMDAWSKSLLAEGVTVHRRELKGLSQRPLRFVQALLDKVQIEAVASLCFHVRPDAILVNQQYDEDGLDYLKGALISGMAPVGGVMHMPMTAGKNLRPLGYLRGKFLAFWYRRNPYRLILVSEGAQREFENYYGAPRPTLVVNNSIPIDNELLPFVEHCTSDTREPVVGFVGQFVAQKNLFCLVHAWLLARDAGSDCRLLLIGDGPERTMLESMLKLSAPAGSWSITGWQENPEAMLSKLDVFVLTSHFEGLPLSLVEAAGRGIPCVVAPFNGALDVAKHAHWVRVAKSNSVQEIAGLLMITLNGLNKINQITQSDMEAFRIHFCLKRMATEIANGMFL
jgi:glycosyltransferase involved in cell wall biosynthesis